MNLPDPPFDPDRHQAGCIYCGGLGPYTDEHVVPAGLGGDDKEWMLRGCVCTVCNNQTFSKLETHMFKQSHIALMRMYSQPATRDGTPPGPLQASTTMTLGGDIPSAQGSLGHGGDASLFAQISYEVSDDSKRIEFPLLGPDRESIEALLTAVGECVQDAVLLTKKHGPRRFTTTALSWSDNRYLVGASAEVDKPPMRGVWFDPREATRGAPAQQSVVFLRPAGQLDALAPDVEALARMLSDLRTHLQEIVRNFEETPTVIRSAHPCIKVAMAICPSIVDRVCVKTGLNLVAHLYAPEVLRDPAFDDAIAFVLGVQGPVRRAQQRDATLDPKIQGRHVFRLLQIRTPTGNWALVFTMRLYGAGPTDCFVLAETKTQLLPAQPVVVYVDYVSNRIESMSPDDHLLRGFGLANGAPI